MSNVTREPLTPGERKRLWRSLYWSLASVAVFPLTVAWMFAGPRLAKSLGIEQHLGITYHDELIAIPFFLAFNACVAMSCANGSRVARKRRICYAWMFGPLIVVYLGPFVWVAIINLSS